MKHLSLTNRLLAFTFALSIFLASCSSDSDNPTNDDQNLDEVILSATIDDDMALLDDLANSTFETQENTTGRTYATESINTPILPPCATITAVLQQNNVTVTIDFGEEGCMVNNRLLRGVVVHTWTHDPDAQEITITRSFQDFYINARNIAGGGSILRERFNDNNNPQSTHNYDITVTWPNGDQAYRTGTKVREFIEGFDTPEWQDNVFLVTGNWSHTFVNGNTHNHEVLVALRREACPHFVSGLLQVERTNIMGVLDFGDGTCDNLATFTFTNGTVVEIVLN
jgi:hypothetical protein